MLERGYGGLAMAWWLFAEIPPNGAHPFTIVADGFASALRVVLEDPRTQQEKVLALQEKYVMGVITAVSLGIQLEHLPGGLPPIESA